MMMPVHELAQLTWEEVRDLDRARTVVVLPVGAIEAHGPHDGVKLVTGRLFFRNSVADFHSDAVGVEAGQRIQKGRVPRGPIRELLFLEPAPGRRARPGAALARTESRLVVAGDQDRQTQ